MEYSRHVEIHWKRTPKWFLQDELVRNFLCRLLRCDVHRAVKRSNPGCASLTSIAKFITDDQDYERIVNLRSKYAPNPTFASAPSHNWLSAALSRPRSRSEVRSIVSRQSISRVPRSALTSDIDEQTQCRGRISQPTFEVHQRFRSYKRTHPKLPKLSLYKNAKQHRSPASPFPASLTVTVLSE